MPDPLEVLGGRAPRHAEDLVALSQQKLREIRAVLARDAGYQGTAPVHPTFTAARAASRVSTSVCSSGISGSHPVACRMRVASPSIRGISAGRIRSARDSTSIAHRANETIWASTSLIATERPDATLYVPGSTDSSSKSV